MTSLEAGQRDEVPLTGSLQGIGGPTLPGNLWKGHSVHTVGKAAGELAMGDLGDSMRGASAGTVNSAHRTREPSVLMLPEIPISCSFFHFKCLASCTVSIYWDGPTPPNTAAEPTCVRQ